MADGIVQVPPDSTGKKVDAASMDVGANTVYRQRIVLADNSATAEFATITGGALLTTGTFNVSGTVLAAITNTVTVTVSGQISAALATGANNIGVLNHISRTAQVAIGTPFTVNNISASVLVATGATADFNTLASADQVQTLPLFGFALPAAGGAVAGGTSTNPISVIVENASATVSVVLAAGAENIGSINNISATVLAAITNTVTVTVSGQISAALATGVNNIGAINHISRTVAATIATPFTVNNISATTIVAGTVSLGAGTANIGTLNDISRTVQVAVGTPFTVNNISATVTVVGVVSLATGSALIGDINAISRTVQVAVGTPFTVNNISATVSMVGIVNISATAAVVLAAGTANFGTLNDISRTVQVAIGTPFTVNNVSATVVVSGLVGITAGAANIGFINHISATVTVAGNVNISATASVILAAGTANFGTLNDISRTVQVAIGTPFTVNNISASVTVTGLVGLTAGAANIGFINHVSATVQVAVGTPFTVNNISATANVAVTTFAPVFRQVVGARASLTATGLGTLAAATYLVTDSYNCNTNKPTDVIVELGVGTTNTPAGNFRVVVFMQESLDGTNFRSGPTSGTTTTDEPDLKVLGILPLNTSSTGATHIGLFSLYNACGFMPHTFRLVIKNDVGVALTTATLVTSEITTVAS